MISIDPNILLQWHRSNKQDHLHGRWITLSDIEPILQKLNTSFDFNKIGESTLGKSIYKVTIGTGKTNVLIWSQMHGNESTGTKALFDFFKFFENPGEFKELRDQILKTCQITCIPMLNPDGAEVYTRVNATDIDLNRDLIARKAPETKVLVDLLEEVQPNYCFNLHDQRTKYTVGDTRQSATLSFLAPSEDEERTLTEGRKEAMKIIVAINKLLQKVLPGQIGRYTDEFYPTATGDNFQKMGYTTVLVEAGHYKDDYQREEVRAFNFLALLQGLNYITSDEKNSPYKPYFDIPNNTENHLDIIYNDVFLESEKKKVDVGILFKENLKNAKLIFEPEIEHIGDLKKYTANSFREEKDLKFTDKEELQRFLKKIS